MRLRACLLCGWYNASYRFATHNKIWHPFKNCLRWVQFWRDHGRKGVSLYEFEQGTEAPIKRNHYTMTIPEQKIRHWQPKRMFLTTRVSPGFERPKGSVFDEVAANRYDNGFSTKPYYSSTAKRYFALSFDDRLRMVQDCEPGEWQTMPSSMQYDSVLVLRLMFGLRGIQEQVGGNWQNWHGYILGALGDGNCFFRTLSTHLYGSQDEHLEIRKLVAEHL